MNAPILGGGTQRRSSFATVSTVLSTIMTSSDAGSDQEPTEQDAILNLKSSTVCTNRWMCVFGLLGACNTCCIVALSVIVITLFGQLQFMNVQLDEDEQQISSLRQQVQDQQEGQIQELTKQVDEQHSYTIYQLAGTFTLLTCLLTMFHMATHLRNFNEPVIQRKIVTILWMSPIYSVTSFLSLLFTVTEGYLAIVKDFYEAYVVYTFLSFLIAVLGRGNREVVVETLARHADHLQQPTRCFRRLYDPPPDTSDQAKANAVLLECQILAMQFVFLRPLTSIANFLVLAFEKTAPQEDDNESSSSSAAGFFMSPHFFIAMIQNVSVFLAFTGLLKFYHTVREDLAWLKPFSKFLAIKGIVFLTFWQGLVIAIFVNINHRQTENGGGEVDNSLSSTLGMTSLENSVSDMFSDSNTTAAPTSGGERFLPEDMSILAVNGTEAPFNDINNDNYHSDKPFDPRAQAVFIQNTLICLEMLFFSLAHWCVFPSEEWEPDYSPRQVARPGMGLKDFAKDVRTIMGRGPKARHGAPLPLPQNARDNDPDSGPSVDEDVIVYSDEEPQINTTVNESNRDEEYDLELI